MIGSGARVPWLSARNGAIPSLVALIIVVVFWILGLIAGASYLRDASSPLAMLAGLYIMLAAVALSIIVTTAALSHLARHFSRQHSN